MVIGRLAGIAIATLLSSTFVADNLLWQMVLWFNWITLGFFISVIVSIFLGVNVNTDQPSKYDSEKYWTDKYGEEMGKEAYKTWLDEV